jgi:hypothetical protein
LIPASLDSSQSLPQNFVNGENDPTVLKSPRVLLATRELETTRTDGHKQKHETKNKKHRHEKGIVPDTASILRTGGIRIGM